MKLKKSLGQNFFINKNLAKQITSIVVEENPDIIVEIGPGEGFFTNYFCNIAKLFLIEKDDSLAKDLERKFPKAEIKNIDFLEWDLNEIGDIEGKRVLFWGSLPYNVSKKIIKKVITSDYFNAPSFFIIQKEVAEKYSANKPSNNLLSVQTSLSAETKKILTISPDSFKPKPKVYSTFISFKPDNKFNNVERVSFEKFLKVCFSQPRKTLKNNLKRINLKRTDLIEPLLLKRPQHLSTEEFILIYNNLDDLLI
jgi:16S rRNA (adenine1518-N6/adenine1519-N6)-dimethyltransferase